MNIRMEHLDGKFPHQKVFIENMPNVGHILVHNKISYLVHSVVHFTGQPYGTMIIVKDHSPLDN